MTTAIGPRPAPGAAGGALAGAGAGALLDLLFAGLTFVGASPPSAPRCPPPRASPGAGRPSTAHPGLVRRLHRGPDGGTGCPLPGHHPPMAGPGAGSTAAHWTPGANPRERRWARRARA
ncbi:MAG: hypothetical protein U5R48_19430 [Gammaproteobacteria bacterium]|nr:hypothetical protein [Gammaproteobacteria bacterium]